jgi:hypothetical protein
VWRCEEAYIPDTISGMIEASVMLGVVKCSRRFCWM